MPKKNPQPTFNIEVTESPSSDWPGMDWRAALDLAQHGQAPGVRFCVRASSRETAVKVCGQMHNDWEMGHQLRRFWATADLARETCPYEIDIFDPGERIGAQFVESDVLCAAVEIPFPDQKVVGILMVDLQEGASNARLAPEEAARRSLILHYNHWKQGPELLRRHRERLAAAESK